jgi:hypothetical protein
MLSPKLRRQGIPASMLAVTVTVSSLVTTMA